MPTPTVPRFTFDEGQTRITELERENTKLRAALKHFQKPASEIGGSGNAYSIMVTGQKQLREALGERTKRAATDQLYEQRPRTSPN